MHEAGFFMVFAIGFVALSAGSSVVIVE